MNIFEEKLVFNICGQLKESTKCFK